MILYRCFAWRTSGREDEPDGPRWVPRAFQGDGRHDNPDVYGVLYLADSGLSCIVEALAPFRGQALIPALLRRRNLPLALAELEISDDVELIDLDEPRVLQTEGLRPSAVATRRRDVTQPQALTLYRGHPRAAGLRWWSTFEALWTNVTLYDRAVRHGVVLGVRELAVDDGDVVAAAEFLGLAR